MGLTDPTVAVIRKREAFQCIKKRHFAKVMLKEIQKWINAIPIVSVCYNYWNRNKIMCFQYVVKYSVQYILIEFNTNNIC